MHWRRGSILTELGLEEGFPRNAWIDSHFFSFPSLVLILSLRCTGGSDLLTGT